MTPVGFRSLRFLALAVTIFGAVSGVISAYDITRNDNLAVYWGQDGSGKQQDITTYCQDDTIDNIIIAFLYIFRGPGGEPEIDVGNTCSSSGNPVFTGTDLADCSFMASQIETCQKNGKIVTLSLGGADAKPGFSSDSQAEAFADQIWNSFLGGSSGPRPFGNAVLDGVDLDIEEGAPTGYAAFVNQIRSHAKGSTKRFYITAAPQCPFPDANIGQALNDASFDAVYVQFYNNYCGLDQPKEYNFATWDHWAKTTSANKDIKVYIGAPASKDAAGTGYVDAGTLADYGKQAQDTWSSFGGVMLWDVSLAVANNNFHEAIKSSLSKGAPPRTSNPPSPDPAPRPPPTGSPAPSEPKSKTTSASETATSTKSAVPVKVTVPTRVGKNIVIEVPRVDSRFFRF